MLVYLASGWRSGKNTRLSPERSEFDSRPGKYVSWICGPSPTSGVFSGYSGVCVCGGGRGEGVGGMNPLFVKRVHNKIFCC